MCLVHYRPPIDRLKGSMTFDLFRRLVDGNPNLRRLTLQGLGEPLLAPDLIRMIRYAKDRGIDAGFNTNATLLSRQRAVELVAAGVAWVHVSIDGATAETYERIRRQGNYERVWRNLRSFAEVVAQQPDDERPEVHVVFVAQRDNIAELPRLVELVADAGVGVLAVQNLSHDFSDANDEAYVHIRSYAQTQGLWSGDSAVAAGIFDDARAIARRTGVDLRLPALHSSPARGHAESGCDWPQTAAYVTHDGTVQPCCMVMGSDRARLGNVREQAFDEVWRDEPYRRFRAALRTPSPPSVCRGCSLYRRVFL